MNTNATNHTNQQVAVICVIGIISFICTISIFVLSCNFGVDLNARAHRAGHGDTPYIDSFARSRF